MLHLRIDYNHHHHYYMLPKNKIQQIFFYSFQMEILFLLKSTLTYTNSSSILFSNSAIIIMVISTSHLHDDSINNSRVWEKVTLAYVYLFFFVLFSSLSVFFFKSIVGRTSEWKELVERKREIYKRRICLGRG